MKAIYLILVGMFMIGLVGAGILTTTTLTKEVEVSKENLTILTTAKVNSYDLIEKDKGSFISLMIKAEGKPTVGKVINKSKEVCDEKSCVVSLKTSKEILDEKIKFEKDYLNNLIEQQKKLDAMQSKASTEVTTITKVTLTDKSKGIVEEILG